MPAENIEKLLKGTFEEAEEARRLIRSDMMRYMQSGHKEAKKHQLQYSVSVMRNICVAARSPEGIHYPVYFDIIFVVLIPVIDPTVSPPHWGRFLEYLYHLHYTVVNKSKTAEAKLIFEYLYRCQRRIHNEGDHKFVLGIYKNQMTALRSQIASEGGEVAANENVTDVVKAYTQLFNEILRQSSVPKFSYPNIMKEFIQSFVPSRSTNHFKFVTALRPSIRGEMFKAFFELLASQSAVSVPDDQSESYLRQYIDAICVLVHIDLADKLDQQLTLQLLRIMRLLQPLQRDEFVTYSLSMLYYFVKLIFSRIEIPNFAVTFMEICRKFTNLFDKSGDFLMQQQWFVDYVLTINLFCVNLQQHPTSQFVLFWQQMTNVDCYSSYLDMLLSGIRLSRHITQSELAAFPCCSSIRKHIILSFAQMSLAAYSSLSTYVKVDELDEKALDIVHKKIQRIAGYAVEVIATMTCPKLASNDLRVIFSRIGQITHDIKQPHQGLFGIALIEQMVKIRTKFSTADWTLMLRWAYKSAQCTGDKHLVGEMHSYYIGALIKETAMPCLQNVLQQISYFYANFLTAVTDDGENGAKLCERCLVEYFEKGESALKPSLDTNQRQLLRWLDQQTVLMNLKNNEAVMRSLLAVTPSAYHSVLIIRAGSLASANAEIMEKLSGMVKMFQYKMSKAKITRLELLTYAHAAATLQFEQIKLNRKGTEPLAANNCTDDGLEELFQRKEFKCPSVEDNLKTVMAVMEALRLFEQFYNQADSQPLLIAESSYIEWEYILDDLAAIGAYLQLCGYLQYAASAWHLLYRMSNGIDDQVSSLRALSFFCEHSEYADDLLASLSPGFQLPREVAAKELQIADLMTNMDSFSRHRRKHILLALIQMAFFYASRKAFVHAGLLIDLVERKHYELSQGKYDLVSCSVEAVKFRLRRKFLFHLESDARPQQMSYESSLSIVGGNGDTLFELMEDLVNGLCEVSSAISSDLTIYTNLLFNMVFEISECTGTRLWGYGPHLVFPMAMKISIFYGYALRMVHLLSMSSFTNLQMEFVGKARGKLQMLERMLGVKRPESEAEQNLYPTTTPTMKKLKPSSLKLDDCSPALLGSLNTPAKFGIQTIRRVAQVHTSPVKVKTDEAAKSCDLQRFLLDFRSDASISADVRELFQWTLMTVGVLYARLLYLDQNYVKLDVFYEDCCKWLQSRVNKFLGEQFQNWQLIASLHYVNYLRASHQLDKATECVRSAMKEYRNVAHRMDAYYYVDAMIQWRGIRRRQFAEHQIQAMGKTSPIDFNLPADKRWAKDKNRIKEELIQQAIASGTKTMKLLDQIKKQKSNGNPAEKKPSKGDGAVDKGQRETKKKPSVSSDNDNEKSDEDLNVCQVIEVVDLISSDDWTSPPQIVKVTGKSVKTSKKRPAGNRAKQMQEVNAVDLIADMENLHIIAKATPTSSLSSSSSSSSSSSTSSYSTRNRRRELNIPTDKEKGKEEEEKATTQKATSLKAEHSPASYQRTPRAGGSSRKRHKALTDDKKPIVDEENLPPATPSHPTTERSTKPKSTTRARGRKPPSPEESNHKRTATATKATATALAAPNSTSKTRASRLRQ